MSHYRGLSGRTWSGGRISQSYLTVRRKLYQTSLLKGYHLQQTHLISGLEQSMALISVRDIGLKTSTILSIVMNTFKWPRIYADAHINVKELYPILIAMQRWGEKWRNCKVDCITDNTQVLYAINTGRSKCELSMRLLRQIFWLCVEYNCHLTAFYIKSADNVIADGLSRLSDENIDVSCLSHLCCHRIVAKTSRVR